MWAMRRTVEECVEVVIVYFAELQEVFTCPRTCIDFQVNYNVP